MKTFLSFLAAYIAAGSFGVALVMSAAVAAPTQWHQSYVRVVR